MMNRKLLAALTLSLIAKPALADDADPRWTQGAMASCHKACQRQYRKNASRVIPDMTVIDVEKCDNVACDCGGQRVRTNLDDGSFCARYLIVTPPPKPVYGKCSRGRCQTP